MSTIQKSVATYQRHLTGLVSGVVTSTYGAAITDSLRTWARGILGVAVISVLPTVTAAEGHATKIRITCKSLSITNEEFVLGNVSTSAPATNEGAKTSLVDFIPLDWTCGGSERITVDCAPMGASTAGELVEVAWLLTNNPDGLPRTFKDALVGGSCLPRRGGMVQDAQQLTVVPTAMTAITTDAWAEAIIGAIGTVQKTGAITAGEEGIGTFEFRNSIVPDFNIPCCCATSSTLGTPVDYDSISGVRYLPCYIPLTGKEEVFTPWISMRTAVTTDNRVSAGLIWR